MIDTNLRLEEEIMDYRENNGPTDGISGSHDWFKACGLIPKEAVEQPPCDGDEVFIVIPGKPGGIERTRNILILGCFVAALGFAVEATYQARPEQVGLTACILFFALASTLERL